MRRGARVWSQRSWPVATLAIVAIVAIGVAGAGAGAGPGRAAAHPRAALGSAADLAATDVQDRPVDVTDLVDGPGWDVVDGTALPAGVLPMLAGALALALVGVTAAAARLASSLRRIGREPSRAPPAWVSA